MNFFEDFFGFVTGSGGFEALIQGEGTMIPQARRLACPCSLFASISVYSRLVETALSEPFAGFD